jgi:exopolyphosphatase/pppGpp-phosphohydrolase
MADNRNSNSVHLFVIRVSSNDHRALRGLGEMVRLGNHPRENPTRVETAGVAKQISARPAQL